MKRLLPFLSVLALAGALLAQDAPLKITGPNVQSVIVSETLPVTIEAPDDGGALHQWQLPDRVVGVSRGRFFDVTSAPAGKVAIGVRYVIATVEADWEKKTSKVMLLEKVNVATFLLGKPEPPPDPIDPEAVPSAALKKTLQDAYTAEPDPLKASRVAAIARFLVPAVRSLRQSGAVKTNSDFQALLHKAEDINPEIGQLDSGAVRTVRTAIGGYIASVLPREAGTPVDDEFWRKATTAYSQVAQALKAVK